jgi:hypothetical protein
MVDLNEAATDEPIKEVKQAIKGYRQLSQTEMDLINESKDLGTKVERFISRLQVADALEGGVQPDQRFLAIGKSYLQIGFMALNRSIAKPDGF